MTDSSQAWTPDLGDKFADFGDLKTDGTFSISLLGTEIWIYLDDSMWINPNPQTTKVPCSDHIGVVCVDRLGSPLECERLWNLSLEFYPMRELVSC
ncbi:hypothetical protein AVEN_26894-1 [Araneus ventricosus]|uniref:Uncharacterized protein n=1 Tax=Araneus ventricosus TaxID=182803 RepID=A0A4Y2KFD1_ARAVE|nr:hypothetical protein AVEN_26894-1 [Araneus ventricosus]